MAADTATPRRETVMRIATPDMAGVKEERSRALHVLFAATGCATSRIVTDLLPRLADTADVALRCILDPAFSGQDFLRASACCPVLPNTPRGPNSAEDIEHEAAELVEWAHLLVLGPMDASTLAKMLHGHTDTLLLEVLRSWDVSKKAMLVPGMSALVWENPMTKKQLTKIRRKWNWIEVLSPILWNFSDGAKQIVTWDTPTQELVAAVRNQADLMNIGRGLALTPSRSAFATAQQRCGGSAKKRQSSRLPPELWTMIIDFTGDWELAQTLHIYTNLSPPQDWTSHTSARGPADYMECLELTLLRGNLADVQHFIATNSVPRWLSTLCIRLIMRFAMTPLLAHLEAAHKDLFWATFGHTVLPDIASRVFGRTEILEFWRTSPSFLTKEYNTEALDGASRAGFVHVLEWWQHSSLPLKFTEAAMEQASGQGHLGVLEWWRAQSAASGGDDHDSDSGFSAVANNHVADSSKVRLKPGKSICYATQNGHANVVAWWLTSGIPFPHEDTVAKLASTHGHVDILTLWLDHKGPGKVIFDNQVLVGATKGGNVDVLEWWRRSGLKVEYKTCDVEEALEDGLEGAKGLEVRRWWARNGLNLGVGTSEWMKTKFLNA